MKSTKIINGTYTSAKIFTCASPENELDAYAAVQLQMLCDNPVSQGSKIRVMPDVHPGKVGTVGLTMTVGARVMPNIVGIDIGCGMTLAEMNGKRVEFQKLDTVIRERVPSGFHIRSSVHLFADSFDFSRLACAGRIRKDKALHSLGTLGGGNHFIEIDKDDENHMYAVVHSGSRHLGKEVTEYYLSEGQKQLKDKQIDVPYELTWLEGSLKEDYLHDLEIVQEYAALNRQIMLEELAKGMKWKYKDMYSCIHNYVDDSSEQPILRKGAISAKEGEMVIIPVNMRDGILLGTGRGNEDWNQSAPHGAGRILKREDVKSCHTLAEFKKAMKGIYSPSINKETLDEAPFAYRGLEEIAAVIGDTVTISKTIRPVYNFKAGAQER